MLPASASLLDAVPAGVRALGDRIAAMGGRAWLVGGAVRDLVLAHPVVDWDLATDLPPASLAAVFPEAQHRDLHLGACRLHLPGGGSAIVTALRQESDYLDHRHPSTVRFVTDPVIDAQRRDFTANALYLELGSGRLLDPTGGLADLQRGVLRAIGAPDQRFREDALRLLRAVRCAARYGLDLDPAVAAAVRARAGLATTLSAERVLAELTAMFTAPGRGRALRMLHRLGLSQQLLPEVAALEGVSQPPQYHPEGDVLVHTCLVLEHAPTGDPVLAWSAVLHDIGKPATWRQGEDRIRFDGHDALSADMADAVLGRLRAPSLLRERVVDVVREHIRFAALPDMRPRKRELWMRTPGFRQHVAFHRADCLGSHGDLSRYAAVLGLWRALPPLRPAALCTGRDVLALGVPAGPMVGRLLRELHATAEDRGIEDRDRALALLAEMAGPHVKARGSGGR